MASSLAASAVCQYRTLSPWANEASSDASVSTHQSGNAQLLDNLSQLKEMEQQGLITPGEYAVKKSELLARL